MITKKNEAKGFTLLELLIVIAILAILSVTLVLVLNPAESLRKSRDTQRMSDLSTLKTALGLYMTTVSSVDLDTGVANLCLGETDNTAAQIAYSAPSGTGAVVADLNCGANVAEGADVVGGSTFDVTDNCYHVAPDYSALVDGTGWLPVNLGTISGGSPISSLPLDPTNDTAVAAPTNATLVYRYACQAVGDSTHPSNVFEIDAVLESDQYKVGGTDDKSAKDGGDNPNYYEVGTSVKLIGTGTNF